MPIPGQGEGLLVVGCGLRESRRLAPCRDVAEEAQGIGLVIPFLVLAGLRQCPLSVGVRLLQRASEQLGLPQGKTTERLIDDHGRSHGLLQCCVSSDTASAMRPPSVYAAPKGTAILGK